MLVEIALVVQLARQTFLPVAQWTEQRRPKAKMGVRFPSGRLLWRKIRRVKIELRTHRENLSSTLGEGIRIINTDVQHPY